MINEIIYWELYALVVSFFNGVLLAWIYDNIRAFRRIVRHKTVAFMSVEDIIYGIYAGLSVFVMCFKVADGIIRGFIIMGKMPTISMVMQMIPVLPAMPIS